MKTQPKPIKISPELAARCNGQDQAERMDKLFRAVIAAKPSDVAKQEEKWKQGRQKNGRLMLFVPIFLNRLASILYGRRKLSRSRRDYQISGTV